MHLVMLKLANTAFGFTFFLHPFLLVCSYSFFILLFFLLVCTMFLDFIPLLLLDKSLF